MSTMFPESPKWKEFEDYARLIAKDYPEYKKDITFSYVIYQEGAYITIKFPDANLPTEAVDKLNEKFMKLYPQDK